MLGPRDISLDVTNPVNFVTLAEAKAYLGISGAAEDVTLGVLISSASIMLEKHTARLFSQRTVDERIFGHDMTRFIVLMHRPAIAITSIANDVTGVVEPSTNYRLDKAAGIVSRTDGLVWTGDIRVIYTTGYAAIPAPITLACHELVKAMRLEKARDPSIVIEQSPDVGSTTFRGAVPGVMPVSKFLSVMPEHVARLLQPYMRRFC